MVTRNYKLVNKEEGTYAQVESYVIFKSLDLETKKLDFETCIKHPVGYS